MEKIKNLLVKELDGTLQNRFTFLWYKQSTLRVRSMD